MKTIDELLAEGVAGKRVFVRADLNVPLDGATITDDGRIRAVLPTVKALADAGAKVVVASHLGRPKGEPDRFGAVHRKHASVFDLPARLPHAAGFLIATEVGVLKQLTEDVKRPYVVALGGSKVSDKLAVIDELLGRADRILIGGGMAFTFLKAKGYEIGASLVQDDQLPVVTEYVERAEKNGVELVVPVDVVAAARFPDLKTKAPSDPVTVDADAIPADLMGLDIGPRTGALYASKLADAGTVFWNGPMGVFEHPDYAEGTKAVAQALVDSPAFTVVGGGDSAAAVRLLGFDENAFGHISTGGGASLEYLEGKTLPGLAALEG
ncbi:phosphoglycerate kinase [Streptomyces sp. MBT97]|uniref:phosphoglycerate kinase n=1 Tax=Streptomyces sp. MBT97 TaxID=2800411 RepID=UPI00190C72D7|nr:phosphoglycerate kinase [Streptomyces sp. MBT97]MBK3634167.1 phosphoglycerate kinase [Streptomyces sp. MBT97]